VFDYHNEDSNTGISWAGQGWLMLPSQDITPSKDLFYVSHVPWAFD
jgi:hypothetical protein